MKTIAKFQQGSRIIRRELSRSDGRLEAWIKNWRTQS